MLRRLFLLCGISFAAASSALAQSTLTGDAVVVSEWKGQDRGDGSGTYELTTTVTSGLVEMVHELTADRSVEQEVSMTEFMRVLENGSEKGRATSDPTGLGPWSGPFVAYVAPFDVDLSGAPRRNYRPSDGRVKEIVHSVVPDAKASTRRASDGRTSAEVEVTGTFPANELAEKFLAIRQAFREAEVGLARLRIRGTASAPTPVTE